MKNVLPSKSMAIVISASLAAAMLVPGCGPGQEGRNPVLSPDLETGMARLRKGDYEGAVEVLEKAARDMPLNGSIQCNLGIACWRLGRTDQAVEALQKAANSTGCDARPLEFLGLVLMDAGDWDAAREILVEAHERAPESARILTCLAATEIRSGKDGVPHLQQALDIQPNYAPALYNLAVTLRDRAASLPVSSEQAVRLRARAAECCKTYLAVMKGGAGDLTPQDEQRVALADRLLASLTTPGTAKPKPPPVKRPPNPLLEKARRAIAQQAYEAALIIIKQAIKKYPDDPDALWELAVVYDKHLKYADSAAETYKEFRKKFPDDPRAGGGQKQSSPPTGPGATTARDTTPGSNAIQLFAKGRDAQSKGRWDTAIDYYKRALRVDSSYAVASYNLGLIYYSHRKDMKKARDAFSLATMQDKEMSKAYYMLGLVYDKLKEPAKAIAQLNAALRIQPDYTRVHFVLGQIYQAESQSNVAEIHLKRYLQYAPQGPYAPRAKELLREIQAQKSGASRKPPMPR